MCGQSRRLVHLFIPQLFIEHLLCAGTTLKAGAIVEKTNSSPCLTELTLWKKLGEAVPAGDSQRRTPVVEKPLCSQTDRAAHQPFFLSTGHQGLLLVVTTLGG